MRRRDGEQLTRARVAEHVPEPIGGPVQSGFGYGGLGLASAARISFTLARLRHESGYDFRERRLAVARTASPMLSTWSVASRCTNATFANARESPNCWTTRYGDALRYAHDLHSAQP